MKENEENGVPDIEWKVQRRLQMTIIEGKIGGREIAISSRDLKFINI